MEGEKEKEKECGDRRRIEVWLRLGRGSSVSFPRIFLRRLELDSTDEFGYLHTAGPLWSSRAFLQAWLLGGRSCVKFVLFLVV